MDGRLPIVLAPLAGGPSTPELAAAVSGAGGLGFLGAGYKSASDVAANVAATRALTSEPIGVNVFCASPAPADPAIISSYASTLCEEGELGAPRFDDDDFGAKVQLLIGDPVAVVSFTFGCPEAGDIERLQAAGTEVWITVTEPEEARIAASAGADALVVQGVEAGGHRGTFEDADGRGEIALLPLLELVRAAADLPLIAAGAIMTSEAVAGVLAAGAVAAQCGTAFLLCPEAGTPAVLRNALGGNAPTALTRAFTGRKARGIVNRFMTAHSAQAPSAYPEVHHLTSTLRAAGRAGGDPEVVNLWAGQAYELARPLAAADVVRALTPS